MFETGFAVFLKLSHGLTKPWPTVGFAACALISFGLLTIALRQLEVGPAYAVWTGIGAAGSDSGKRAGFAVLSTESGAEAITLAAPAVPDLVVLDLRLPDVPLEVVAGELRSAGPTPILMLTAKGIHDDRIRGLELGATDYVSKPFSPRELVLRVQVIVRRGNAARRAGITSYGGGALVIDEPRRSVSAHGNAAARRIPLRSTSALSRSARPTSVSAGPAWATLTRRCRLP